MPILTGLSIEKQDISYLEGHFSVAFPITLSEMPIVPVETMGIDGHRLCTVRQNPFSPSESGSSH